MTDAVAMRQANGFVVVSRWTKARYQWSAPSFDVFETLDKAREELRRLQNHEIDDFAPVGIFPAFNGMPIACSLDLNAIEAVS